jgi:hypothetical protein
MLARMLADLPAAVPCVADDPVRTVFGAAAPAPLHRPACHEVRKDDGFMALARRQDEGEQLATPLGPEVDRCTEAALAAA